MIPDPFPDGRYLDKNIAPAYCAYSPRNAKEFSSTENQKFPGRNPDNQRHVMFMNYGRIEDYEALFSENKGKESEIRSALSGDIIIVRYVADFATRYFAIKLTFSKESFSKFQMRNISHTWK